MPQPPTAGGEAELIRRVCGGEREAFCELVHPYERMVYVTAISVLKNPADAEDVAQEAMLKAFTKLASFRGESRFSTWLIQITYNEARLSRGESGHIFSSRLTIHKKDKTVTIGPKTLLIGVPSLPKPWKMTKIGAHFKMRSIHCSRRTGPC